MFLKKTAALLAAILLAATVLAPCTLWAAADDVTTLYVYNWGEYISDGSEDSLDVNAAFEEYCELALGKQVKVNYSTYASNEDLYAKLSSNTVSYDVVIPSDYMIARLAAENLIQKFDPNELSNYQYIDDAFKGLYYDPNDEYSVPYTYGTVGIIYNTKYVAAEDVGSWGLMWNEKYAGNILQFNNPRDAFGTAQFYQKTSVNSEKEEEWRSALDLLKKQKSVVQGYVMDEVFNKMKGNSAYVAPYYAGDFFTMYEDNEDLAFFYPQEGTNVFVDAMCIPANSQNPELAKEYINFMLSKDTAIANAEYICYASPNKLVVEDPDYIEAMKEIHPDAISILYDYDISSMEYFHDLPDATRNLMNDLWEQLKIEGGAGSTIYYIAGAVVVALVALFVGLAISKRKKKLY